MQHPVDIFNETLVISMLKETTDLIDHFGEKFNFFMTEKNKSSGDILLEQGIYCPSMRS